MGGDLLLDEYDIQEAFASIEEELTASMMRNMKRHRIEEIAEGKEWSMWQAEQLKALEQYKKVNEKAFTKKFNVINNSIDDIISRARQNGSMDQEIEVLKAIKNGFKPPRALKKSVRISAEFFRLNDKKLNALIKATKQDFIKAEYAMLRRANDQYRKIIFNAQVYANTGAGTYEKAIDMATKDFLTSGINCIEYSNGARHTMSDYADMCLRTATKRAYLTGEGEKRKEWGISTVIMNKRGNPCPLCLPFVGKVLIDDVWSDGSEKDGPYPLMSDAIARGLYHPRCRDNHSTYFPGISSEDNAWTKKELGAVRLENNLKARKQYANRTAGKYERLATYSLDEENKKDYGAKAIQWNKIVGGTLEKK